MMKFTRRKMAWSRPPLTSLNLLLMACALFSADAVAQDDVMPPNAWYYSVKGELEFDGKKLAYDDLIEVYTVPGTTSTMGLVKGDNRTFVSRSWITRALPGGSLLAMEVPNATHLWVDLRSKQREYDKKYTPRTPEFVQTNFRPPSEVLAEFYLIDVPVRPTRIEAYLSAAYYAQEKARIKILQPFKVAFVPQSTAAHITAISQRKEQPKFDLAKGRPPGAQFWKGVRAFLLQEGDWRRSTVANAEIDKINGQGPVMLSKQASKEIHEIARRSMQWAPGATEDYGVPQPQKFPGTEGVLTNIARGRYEDETIPVECDWEQNVCWPLFNLRGYAILYDHPINVPGISFKIDDTTIEKVWPWYAIYRPETRTIILLGEKYL